MKVMLSCANTCMNFLHAIFYDCSSFKFELPMNHVDLF